MNNHNPHNYTEPRQDETPAVEIINARKSYCIGEMEVPVLQGIDLAIRRGEFLAIMGQSGSGKSTLANLIGCRDHPTEGEIRVLGNAVNKLSNDELAHLRGEIGFVFQTFDLASEMSVFQNVELPAIGCQKHGYNPEKRAKELLELVGLAGHIHHKPTQLSGGQRQRVAIARALVNDPAIILADEPTASLDTRTGDEIMKIFRDLNRDGRTIIMITHDPAVASHADRIMYVKNGLLADGNT
ncbi:MAG: ABC transporter ATP-binding protein [Candidatus Methanogaster sp.]|uniref:ABC transporter ATP-binding protein n=1 Tax=Candidatus Methanogaster sp. TaxID=3386292 RepID=A0AC61L379_9EURY|nr:MAG: ABC transporter ATP-binding protein [ANME-2 cluster archaeon]